MLGPLLGMHHAQFGLNPALLATERTQFDDHWASLGPFACNLEQVSNPLCAKSLSLLPSLGREISSSTEYAVKAYNSVGHRDSCVCCLHCGPNIREFEQQIIMIISLLRIKQRNMYKHWIMVETEVIKCDITRKLCYSRENRTMPLLISIPIEFYNGIVQKTKVQALGSREDEPSTTQPKSSMLR